MTSIGIWSLSAAPASTFSSTVVRSPAFVSPLASLRVRTPSLLANACSVVKFAIYRENHRDIRTLLNRVALPTPISTSARIHITFLFAAALLDSLHVVAAVPQFLDSKNNCRIHDTFYRMYTGNKWAITRMSNTSSPDMGCRSSEERMSDNSNFDKQTNIRIVVLSFKDMLLFVLINGHVWGDCRWSSY